MKRCLVFSVAVLLASSSYAQSSKKKNANPPPAMSCEQIAAASHGSVTVEACKQMMRAQQALDAASDPTAARPGDDKMTCDQIAAEMKQQPITPPDQARVTEAQAATADFKTTADKEQKEVTALIVKETAEQSLVSKLVPVNAAGAAETKRIEAEQKATNERIAKEMTPKAERMVSASADLIGDVGKQMSANPRMARLFQLATQKQCKMRGN